MKYGILYSVKSTVRVGADPSFVMYRSSLAAKVRQWYQVTFFASLTFEKSYVLHFYYLPSRIVLNYTLGSRI